MQRQQSISTATQLTQLAEPTNEDSDQFGKVVYQANNPFPFLPFKHTIDL